MSFNLGPRGDTMAFELEGFGFVVDLCGHFCRDLFSAGGSC